MGPAKDIVAEVLNRNIYDSIRINDTLTDPDHKFLAFDVCVRLPPKIGSDGLWGSQLHGSPSPFSSTLPLFEMQILTIFIITQSFHLVLKHLGIPYFVSQIMAGFVLGPSFKISPSWIEFKQNLFPYGSEDVLNLISSVGYTFFLFLNCVQMDFSMITRTGRKAWTISICSFVIPTVLGLFTSYRYVEYWEDTLGPFEAKNLPVVVIGQSGCSFAVVACLLSDLEILNSELGRLALSASFVMDVTSTLSAGLGTAVVSSLVIDKEHDKVRGKGPELAFLTTMIYLGIIIMIPLLGRPIMRWFVRRTPEGRPVKKMFIYAVVLMALGVGLFGGYGRQSVLAGISLLGLVVPAGPPLGSELIKQLELFNTWFLLPIFVTSCTMKVDLSLITFGDGKHGLLFRVLVATVVIIHLLKMLITIGVCWHCKMPKTDGLCLGLMLSCKGVVDFCSHVFLHDALLLSNEAISLMTVVVLVLGSMAHIGVKCLYDPARKYAGYQKRNILNLKPNSELRVVACVHKPSHIVPIRNFLDLCCPTTSNPLVVHVLHLMELVGRSSPIFISHRLQERVGSGHHHFSEDVIVTFDLFEHDNAGTATVSTYTAISPLRFMHDDVCYLALDKLASIIILPFHVRYAEDGSIESVEDNIRTLNCKVLERAPCSVGILVNRMSYSNHSETKQIAVIFLGGADDREAVCLAKRAIKEEDAYHLVVYHLVSSKNSESTNWDLLLDDEVLKSVKGVYGSVENVTYERVSIERPSETTAFISEVANQHQHDYIIVGRRNGVKSAQTAALENWAEYPELGVIGDLLASPDTDVRASIIVVQQQQMPKS